LLPRFVPAALSSVYVTSHRFKSKPVRVTAGHTGVGKNKVGEEMLLSVANFVKPVVLF
jgi:hypothetical protein